MNYRGFTLYGYSRVSTEEQSKKGNSLEFQRKMGESISKRNGFDEYIHFDEGDISGTTSPTSRKHFSELLELVVQGKVKHLYVYEWSRFSRDNFYSEWLRRRFLKYDVKIWEGNSDTPKDLSNPTDNLTSSILSSIYTFERQNLIKRIKSGLEESFSKGRWSGVYIPYGYKRGKDKSVVVDEIESVIYFKMIDLVNKGYSIRSITNYLNENNIPTKSSKVVKKGFVKRKRDGVERKVDLNTMVWRDNTVREILISPLRCGVRTVKGKTYSFPKLIDKVKWRKLQERLQENKVINHEGNKKVHTYLLKGLLYCSEHKTLLIGRIKKDERTYYCSRKRKEVRMKNEKPCSLPSPNLDLIENFVWEKFVEILSDSHYIKEEYKKKILSEKNRLSDKSKLQNEITELKNRLRIINQKEDKVLNLFLEEGITKVKFDELNSKIRKEKEELENKIDDKEGNLEIVDNKVIWIDWVERFSKEVKGWNSSIINKEEKKEKLLQYLSKVYVEYNKTYYNLDFIFRYPMINDKLIYRDPNNKSKGYKIKKGKEDVRVKLQKKTTYQSNITDVKYPMIGGKVNLLYSIKIKGSKLGKCINEKNPQPN